MRHRRGRSRRRARFPCRSRRSAARRPSLPGAPSQHATGANPRGRGTTTGSSLARVTTAVTTPPLDPFRLPRTVSPSRYEIELEPDLAGASFHGYVHVVVTAADAVPELVLNAA